MFWALELEPAKRRRERLSSYRLNLESKFLSLIIKSQPMKLLAEEPLAGGPGFQKLTVLLLPSIDIEHSQIVESRVLAFGFSNDLNDWNGA